MLSFLLCWFILVDSYSLQGLFPLWSIIGELMLLVILEDCFRVLLLCVVTHPILKSSSLGGFPPDCAISFESCISLGGFFSYFVLGG